MYNIDERIHNLRLSEDVLKEEIIRLLDILSREDLIYLIEIIKKYIKNL